MFEWEEADRFSFEDSDRFEEDSICSWISEPESVVNNWRGWRGQMKISPNGNSNTALNTNISVNGYLSAAAHSAAKFSSKMQFWLPRLLPLMKLYYEVVENLQGPQMTADCYP
jgi:hypothetical protein